MTPLKSRKSIQESWGDFIARKNEKFHGELEQGKPIYFKDIGRKGRHMYLRTKWTFMRQNNNDEKVFVVERLELLGSEGEIASRSVKSERDVEYRIGYFIVGKNGFLKDKWAWGQFCPMVPKTDLEKLLSKAKEDGTID